MWDYLSMLGPAPCWGCKGVVNSVLAIIWSGVWMTKPISSMSLFLQFLKLSEHGLPIKFIFDRCHHSLAVVTPVKYKCDSKDLKFTYVKSNRSFLEKSMSGALVTQPLGNLAGGSLCEYYLSFKSAVELIYRDQQPSQVCLLTIIIFWACMDWNKWICVTGAKYRDVLAGKQGKSEGFDSCDRPSDLTQIGFKSSIFQPVWPWNLMDDPKKQ